MEVGRDPRASLTNPSLTAAGCFLPDCERAGEAEPGGAGRYEESSGVRQEDAAVQGAADQRAALQNTGAVAGTHRASPGHSGWGQPTEVQCQDHLAYQAYAGEDDRWSHWPEEGDGQGHSSRRTSLKLGAPPGDVDSQVLAHWLDDGAPLGFTH